MATIEWTSSYPGDFDTTTEQPTLTNGVDKTRVSHVTFLAQAIREMEGQIGTGSTGSYTLKERVVLVENSASVNTFVNLDDTPAVYGSNDLEILRVNAAGDAVEFVSTASLMSFTDLSDTSASLAGLANRYVAIGTSEEDLAYVTMSFLDLSDTSASYTDKKGLYVTVNKAGTALEFETGSSGGGATTFVALTDVPAAFGTNDLDLVRVNAAANALEFVSTASLASWMSEQVINVTPVFTTHSLSKTPISSSATVEGIVMDVYRNGILLEWTGSEEELEGAGTRQTDTWTYRVDGNKIILSESLADDRYNFKYRYLP